MGPGAGIAFAADFLFVEEKQKNIFLGRRNIQTGPEAAKGADPVVLPIGADYPPIKTHIPGRFRRDYLQFSAGQVFFHDPKTVVKNLQDGQPETVLPFLGA